MEDESEDGDEELDDETDTEEAEESPDPEDEDEGEPEHDTEPGGKDKQRGPAAHALLRRGQARPSAIRREIGYENYWLLKAPATKPPPRWWRTAGNVLSSVVASQVEEHRAIRRRGAGDRLPPALLRAIVGVVQEALEQAGMTLGGAGRHRGHLRPRAHRRAAGGGEFRQGPGHGRGQAPDAGSPYPGPTLPPTTSPTRIWSRPSSAWWCPAATATLSRCRITPTCGSSAAPGTTRREKPLTRPPGLWACPIPAACAFGPDRAEGGNPDAFRFPTPAVDGSALRFQLFRPENRGHQPDSQRVPKGRELLEWPIWRPLSARAVVDCLVRNFQLAAERFGADNIAGDCGRCFGQLACCGNAWRPPCRERGWTLYAAPSCTCAGTTPPWWEPRAITSGKRETEQD